jgi:phage-related protein
MLLRRLQQGESLGLPHSRPMPGIGPRCHELRIRDESMNWRILYHISPDSVVILDVFRKSTQQTPRRVLDEARRRLRKFQTVQ